MRKTIPLVPLSLTASLNPSIRFSASLGLPSMMGPATSITAVCSLEMELLKNPSLGLNAKTATTIK